MTEKTIYMPEFVYIAKERFSEIDIIFEVGALDAKDSLLFKDSFPNAEVYAFEGLPENYDTYMKNITGVNTFNKVVFNYDGEIIFNKKDINGIHGVFDRGSEYGTTTILLNCYRLDSICKELGIDHIDMIKIDVEGATYEVLEGMGELLKTVKIMHIETEDYPFFKGQRLDYDVTEFLFANGFEIVEKCKCVMVEEYCQYDSVWAKV